MSCAVMWDIRKHTATYVAICNRKIISRFSDTTPQAADNYMEWWGRCTLERYDINEHMAFMALFWYVRIMGRVHMMERKLAYFEKGRENAGSSSRHGHGNQAVAVVCNNVECWWLVSYDGIHYLWWLTDVSSSEGMNVSVIVRYGGFVFRWRAVRDGVYYTMEDIITKIALPMLANARNCFNISRHV